MIRTQILMTKPLLEWVRKESGKKQISASEFIRRVLDERREKS
jgi:hypothetical protein